MNNPLGTYHRGDILLVPFPFTDLSQLKTRPAVVISSASFHTRMSDLILVAISSRTSSVDSTFDLLIPSSHPLFAATGLRTSSVIKVGKIVTLAREKIYHRLGNLPIDLMTRLEQRLKVVFDLSNK